MNRNEEMEVLKKEYQNIKAPQEGMDKMESAIRRAKMDKRREKRKKMVRNWGIGAAAALVLVVLPNTNAQVAYAMGNLPVIGGLFQVITIREYNYEDEHNTANVQTPQIVSDETEIPENSEAIAAVNKSVEEYTDELVEKFEADMAEEGYKELDVSYEVITDTDQWFALKVQGLEVQASGFEFNRYYNIDKTNGKVAELKDLFQDGVDYVTPITEEIKKQMKEQMDSGEAMYFLEDDDVIDGFTQIAENQNFYRKADGSLVIAFDEYEVGPGYIGAPEFSIPDEVISSILK